MKQIYTILDWIDSNILWGIPMLVAIIGAGVILSVRSRFLQVRKFGYAINQTMGKTLVNLGKQDGANKDKKGVSPFEAFCTAVSGTVGTGNIVGVTTAIIMGGPGAVFWMWISAFFGMITKFSEITLGLFFRKKNEKGEYVGGPMFYIEKGLKMKWLAIVFSVFAILAAIGMSSVQADTIQKTWKTTFNVPIWVSALVIAVFVALVIIGGIKRIGKVSSILVPFMAIFFLIMAIIVVISNYANIPSAFASIFTSAFTTKSVLGGFAGYGILSAMRYGFARGVFSNEAGLGSSPIAHASSTEVEPVKQGLWGIFEVFIDTFIICTLTALFVLTSNINLSEMALGLNCEIFELSGTDVALTAFTGLGGIISIIFKYSFSIILPLFAYSTIIAWAVYGARACEYMFGKKSVMPFNAIFVALIIGIGLLTHFQGENMASSFLWLISDMTNALMAIPNLIALIGLSGVLVKVVKNYFDRKKGLDVNALLSYEDLKK